MSLAIQDIAVTVVALVAAGLIVVRFARAWRPSGARSACASCNCASVSRRGTTGVVAGAPGGAAGAATVVPLRLVRNSAASHHAAEQ